MASSSSSPPPLTLNVVGSDSFTSNPPSSDSTLQNLSPSILVIVIVLAVTVTLSLALCLLLRHLNLRCLRRLSPSSSPPSSATTTPVFSTSSRRVSPEIVPSSSIIDSLPLFTFSSITRRSAAAGDGDCAVCLSKFEQRDLLRLLPLCCHAFHAECIDVWLQSNLTCPLCRSTIFASDSDLFKTLRSSSDSFRLEIGSISRRGTAPPADVAADARARSRSYSVGSFEYFVEESDFEVPISQAHRRSVSENKDETVVMESQTAATANLAGDVAAGSGRSWLKDYMDRLSSSISSRTASFRSSGRFFGGGGVEEYDDVEAANRIGEEISEIFRWISGV